MNAGTTLSRGWLASRCYVSRWASDASYGRDASDAIAPSGRSRRCRLADTSRWSTSARVTSTPQIFRVHSTGKTSGAASRSWRQDRSPTCCWRWGSSPPRTWLVFRDSARCWHPRQQERPRRWQGSRTAISSPPSTANPCVPGRICAGGCSRRRAIRKHPSRSSGRTAARRCACCR